MENNSLKIVVIVAVGLVWFAGNGQAKCGDCLPNDIACLNETSFKLCKGSNVLEQSETMTCPEGEVCTGLKIICAPAGQIPAACDDSQGCGICGLGGFTCISKTRYALCSQGSVTTVQGKCPLGSVCEVGSASTGVCVDQCGVTPSCNIDD